VGQRVAVQIYDHESGDHQGRGVTWFQLVAVVLPEVERMLVCSWAGVYLKDASSLVRVADDEQATQPDRVALSRRLAAVGDEQEGVGADAACPRGRKGRDDHDSARVGTSATRSLGRHPSRCCAMLNNQRKPRVRIPRKGGRVALRLAMPAKQVRDASPTPSKKRVWAPSRTTDGRLPLAQRAARAAGPTTEPRRRSFSSAARARDGLSCHSRCASPRRKAAGDELAGAF
jgi:hypothetical protein